MYLKKLIIYSCSLLIIIAIVVYFQMSPETIQESVNTHQQDHNTTANATDAIIIGQDYGTPCKTHKYYFPINTENTFEFQFRLKKEFFTDYLLLKKPDKPITDLITTKESETHGDIVCETNWIDYSVESLYDPMWAIDITAYSNISLGQSNFTKYISMGFSGTIPGYGTYSVYAFSNENSYAILKTLKINDHHYVAVTDEERIENALNDLTPEDMNNLLNGELNVNYVYNNNTINSTLTQIEVNKEVIFVNISINLLVKSFRGNVISYGKRYNIILDKHKESFNLVITRDYKNNLLCIKGPAQASSCYN